MKDNQGFFDRMQELEREVYERTLRTGDKSEDALEAVLSKWERQQGFIQTVNIEKELSGVQFHRIINRKRAFRDEAFAHKDRNGIPHSAQAHRIQWNVIMRDYKANPAEYPGMKNAADVYRMFGDERLAARLQGTNPKMVAPDIWQNMFDSSEDNFTSPETLRFVHEFFPGLHNWY